MATPQLLSRPTPCPGWDLEMLLDHLGDSIGVLHEAIEVAVHGWDLWVACGAPRPVPAGLAAVLLPIAPLLITPAVRPGLFADPVRLPGPAGPGDRLVAFCGRQPRPPAVTGPGSA
jgi:hypothetical protein